MVMKHVVMSQEGGFLWEFGEDVDVAFAEGRKRFTREIEKCGWRDAKVVAVFAEGRKRFTREIEKCGWRDAKVVAVFADGTMVPVGKLFPTRAHYDGYLLAWDDMARPAEADAEVSTAAH
jgi:3-dehydroquinate synthase class II